MTCATYRDQFSAERFLFQEAELLDDFKLLEWLFTTGPADRLPIPVRSTRRRTNSQIVQRTTFHMIEHFGSLESADETFRRRRLSEFHVADTSQLSNIRVGRSAADGCREKQSALLLGSRRAERHCLGGAP